MLINRIHRNMELVLEGVDDGNVGLILEASKQFQKSYDDLKRANSELLAMVSKYSELSGIKDALSDQTTSLDQLDLSKVPEEYSFSAHAEMLNPQSKDGEIDPTQVLSSAATNLSMYIVGLKDAIIEVASWLEEEKDLFSVGKNGIVINPEFVKEITVGEDIKLAVFSQSGEEILSYLKDGVEGDDLREAWAGAAGITADMEEQEAEDLWNAFVKRFDDIGDGASSAYNEAAKALEQGKPDVSVQKAIPKGGLLQQIIGTLFGGSDSLPFAPPELGEIKEEILGENATNPSKGIFAMTFADLQNLIADLMTMSESTNAKGAEALASLDDHNTAVMDPSPEQGKLNADAREIIGDQEETTAALGALEDAGMTDSKPDTVNPDKAREELKKIGFNDDQIAKLLKDLEVIDPDDIELRDEDKQAVEGLEDNQDELENIHQGVEEILGLEEEAITPEKIEKINQMRDKLSRERDMLDAKIEDVEVKKFRDYLASKYEESGSTGKFLSLLPIDSEYSWGVPTNDWIGKKLYQKVLEQGWWDDLRKITNGINDLSQKVDNGASPIEAQKEMEKAFIEFEKWKSKFIDWAKEVTMEESVKRWSILAGIIKG